MCASSVHMPLPIAPGYNRYHPHRVPRLPAAKRRDRKELPMRVPLAMSIVTGLLLAMGPPGQTQQAQAQQPQAQPAPAAPAAQPSQQLLKAEELDALLAPVALYPDALLASVMMAST